MSLFCPICYKQFEDSEKLLDHLFKIECMNKERIISRFVPLGIFTISEIEDYVNRH
jgi:hypothetical protein